MNFSISKIDNIIKLTLLIFGYSIVINIGLQILPIRSFDVTNFFTDFYPIVFLGTYKSADKNYIVGILGGLSLSLSKADIE